MISRNRHGGYSVEVPVPGSHLSALTLRGYAFTSWGARRMEARLSREAEAYRHARDVIHPRCRCSDLDAHGRQARESVEQ